MSLIGINKRSLNISKADQNCFSLFFCHLFRRFFTFLLLFHEMLMNFYLIETKRTKRAASMDETFPFLYIKREIRFLLPYICITILKMKKTLLYGPENKYLRSVWIDILKVSFQDSYFKKVISKQLFVSQLFEYVFHLKV